MRITEEYRSANKILHETNASYGAHGSKWSKRVRELIDTFGCRTILDYGCGKGGLGKSLVDVEISEYDPAIPGKDGEPAPADLVVCADVLEHIEPACLDDVLLHLSRLTRRAAYLHISTRSAVKELPDGRNAHLIIQPSEWWRDTVSRFFSVKAWNTAGAVAVDAVVLPIDRSVQG